MADQRITQLNALPKASVAQDDVLPIVDLSASETKKVTAKDLVDAGLDLISANSIDLDKLDQSSTTKLGTTALADDAVTAAKLANSSSISVGSCFSSISFTVLVAHSNIASPPHASYITLPHTSFPSASV